MWKRESTGWLWWKRSKEFELEGEEVLEDGTGLKGRGWRRYVPKFVSKTVKDPRAGAEGDAGERTRLLE